MSDLLSSCPIPQPASKVQGSQHLHTQPILVILGLIIASLVGAKWYPIVVWICPSLMAGDREHLSLCPDGHLCIFGETSILGLPHF